MKVRKQNLYINAIILTVTSLVLKTIDTMFRVEISNSIGTEGMGIYKLITTISMMVTTLSISGISVAVTRIVSEEIGKKSYNNAKYILSKSCIITFILSMIICTFTIIFSNFIGEKLLKDSRTIISIRILVIGIPFVAISSCIKGYFFAIRNVIIPTISQILRKIIKIGIVISCLSIALSKGIEYGCAVLVLGNVVSEVIECIYFIVVYKIDLNTKVINVNNIDTISLIKNLFFIAIPIASSSYISTALGTLQTILIPMQLIRYGMSTNESISVLGSINGMVMPIVMFPATLLMSMGIILVPEISRAKASNNSERVKSLIYRSISFTIVIGIGSFFIFNTYFNELAVSIYNNERIGELFKIFSYMIPLMYMDMLSNSLLKGLNEQVASLKYNILDSILRITLIYFLIPVKGVVGFIITMFISRIFSTCLSFYRLLKVTDIELDIINWILKPVLAGTVSILIIGIIRNLLLNSYSQIYNLEDGIIVSSVIILTLIIYIIMMNLINRIIRLVNYKESS